MMATERALAGLCLAATLLGACATTDKPASVTRRAEAPAAIPTPPAPAGPAITAAKPAPALPVAPSAVRGPSARSFLGRPLADLEALLGAPALVRREGQAEFRRYDVTEDCRAFAVVAGGQVTALSTGAPIQSVPAPAFEDCTARPRQTGS